MCGLEFPPSEYGLINRQTCSAVPLMATSPITTSLPIREMGPQRLARLHMPAALLNIGYKIADYEILLKWWSDVVRDTVLTVYRPSHTSAATDPSSPWYGTPIAAPVNMNAATPEVKGSIHFSTPSSSPMPPWRSSQTTIPI
jgi:hypothetical protein